VSVNVACHCWAKQFANTDEIIPFWFYLWVNISAEIDGYLACECGLGIVLAGKAGWTGTAPSVDSNAA
jgi:hypothetical protein